MGQWHRDYHNCQIASLRPPTLPVPLPSRALLMALLKRSLKITSHVIMRKILSIYPPYSTYYCTLHFSSWSWPGPPSITISRPHPLYGFLNKLTDTTNRSGLVVRHRCTREGNGSLCLRDFPKENIMLMRYILNTWWLQLLEGLGKYVILPGTVT